LANGEVRIEGLEELERALEGLPKEIRDQLLDRIIDESAEIILRECKRIVPRGKTGKLADSIEIRTAKPRNDEAARRLISPHIYYGAFVEFGTKRSAAKPYMRPTYDGSAKTEAISHAHDEILAGVEKLTDKK
jgi:HK97 gp10 family phage protein